MNILIAREQIHRGLFKEAEITLRRCKNESGGFLSSKELQVLDGMLVEATGGKTSTVDIAKALVYTFNQYTLTTPCTSVTEMADAFAKKHLNSQADKQKENHLK